MVRDLILDITERDLSTVDKSNQALPVFDTVWGNIFDEDEEAEALICNIIVPRAYWRAIVYTDNELICKFSSAYIPDTRSFRIRLVALDEGRYSLFQHVRGDFGLQVKSYALSKNIAAPIAACMLPFIDIDGSFIIRMIKNDKSEMLDKAYIYSSKNTDINVYFSDNQASQLLSLCAPGNSYRYPTTGVGITKYLNRVVAHSRLQEELEAQFSGDGKPINSAVFDNETCKLDVLFSPETEQKDDELEDITNLNKGFFDLFTDEYVRRNIVLNELTDIAFVELLNDYPCILGVFIFKDGTTTYSRIDDNVTPGIFDEDGNVVPSEEYFVISTVLDTNTVIMFDDEMEDELTDRPLFVINDTDESRLYTSLVEQPYWLTESCHKCLVLRKRAEIKYIVRQDRYRDGKGLHIIPQTSANIKNMLGLVQDINTGRLLGVVSDSTNINDMTLDEITQYIYASQINQ